MSKKTIILLVIAGILGGCYFYYFTDFLRRPTIHITARSRKPQVSRINPDVYAVSFAIPGSLKLKEVKVIPATDAKKREPTLLWHLVSPSNSVPTKGFVYGLPINGMAPSEKGTPKPLEAGVTYRIVVSSDNRSGFVDFQAEPVD